MQAVKDLEQALRDNMPPPLVNIAINSIKELTKILDETGQTRKARRATDQTTKNRELTF